MKRLCSLVAVLALAWLGAGAQNLFVGSYNLRNANRGDSVRGNGWGVRMPYVASLIDFERPDVFGTQELLHHQIGDLLERLPDYGVIGRARDDGGQRGEYSAIFYNKTTLKLLDSGDFWLAENPDAPALGWDAACIRICTWGKFRDRRTHKVFCYFNLHMDHVGVTARREGAKLVMQKIGQIAGKKPAVLTGDFNVDQFDEIYTIFTQSGLLRDSYAVAKRRHAPNGTFNSFKPTLFSESRIDHVFITRHFSAEAYAVLPNFYWTPAGGPIEKGQDAPEQIDFTNHILRSASDHHPVFVRLRAGK